MTLTEIRHKRKMTQTQLANCIECSRTLISAYENRTSTPPLETMQKLAKALNVDLATIVNCFVKEKKEKDQQN